MTPIVERAATKAPRIRSCTPTRTSGGPSDGSDGPTPKAAVDGSSVAPSAALVPVESVVVVGCSSSPADVASPMIVVASLFAAGAVEVTGEESSSVGTLDVLALATVVVVLPLAGSVVEVTPGTVVVDPASVVVGFTPGIVVVLSGSVVVDVGPGAVVVVVGAVVGDPGVVVGVAAVVVGVVVASASGAASG